MKFSKKLRELREEKNLTQDQLAEKTGLSHGCIAMLEVEKRAPSGITLITLADFFECSIDYLVGRSDDFGNVTIINGTESLPASEQTLLVTFRSLPPDLQRRAAAYLAKLGELAEEEKAGTGNTSA